jgi:NAD(P)H-dependent flavin oxidoreductase YrpB (nitropropane dioxygenase family)
MGTIGGLTMTPAFLRKEIAEAKELITEKQNPIFGVDLAIPQVGGNARKTNHDYTHGKLPELIDVIIEEGASLFVCAVGVPPKWCTEKLHAAGIPVMNSESRNQI